MFISICWENKVIFLTNNNVITYIHWHQDTLSDAHYNIWIRGSSKQWKPPRMNSLSTYLHAVISPFLLYQVQWFKGSFTVGPCYSFVTYTIVLISILWEKKTAMLIQRVFFNSFLFSLQRSLSIIYKSPIRAMQNSRFRKRRTMLFN